MISNLLSLKDKAVCHLSHNDMDGYAPQIISKLSNVNTVEYTHCGYGDFENKLEELVVFFEGSDDLQEHAILITDIAPKSEELVERLNELFKKGLTIVLLDHHDTSKWISEKYPEWAHIDSLYNDRKTCGTELYYEYLIHNGFYEAHVVNSHYLKSFVEQVRSYDTWDWAATGNIEAKELNSCLYIFGPNKFMQMQVEKLVERIHVQNAVQYTFNETEKIVIDIENKREQKYIESRAKNMQIRKWTIDETEYELGLVFGDQFHSTLGNELNLKNPDLDFILILDLNGGKASLRTIHDHIHVGEIAKAINGGGGHQKAAGFEFEMETSLTKLKKQLVLKQI
ncbi:phosphoesterase [Gottfriedia acidiceleris]|uniref:DHH family phosphoesterase n=1 Tax=Gottfriedia acidiceleris TaxID=371036 RepID=UPI003399B0A2